jgi:hypothetical protein
LVPPYRWASHSGQLEHAFDLGAFPVATRTGYLAEQVRTHGDLVREPVWCDWSDSDAFAYGARLPEAMEQAHSAIQGGWRPADLEAFAEHRRREHAEIVAAYRELYAGGCVPPARPVSDRRRRKGWPT